ncbi:RidA family protein [Streptomyces sp. NPDC048425]|uniref:RidA family protein n=1 Tax=Streptomyces sp. NPDC048425 TaxID=3365548 RepID=UPI00371990D2
MSTTATKGPFVYASSLAIDVATMKLVPEADTVAHETCVVFERIAARLAKDGLSLRDVVKTTCYLSDPSHLDEFVEAYEATFTPGPFPVTTTLFLGIAGNCRVQVEVVAAN